MLLAIIGWVAIHHLLTQKHFVLRILQPGVTALLIDVSDKLTNSQAARLQNELKNISSLSAKRPSPFLKKGDKLLVYFVEPEGQKR